jgi:hypothetical protein
MVGSPCSARGRYQFVAKPASLPAILSSYYLCEDEMDKTCLPVTKIAAVILPSTAS